MPYCCRHPSGRARALTLNHDTGGQAVECMRAGNAFHLHPVRPGMLKLGVGQAVLERAVVGEEHQAFAVAIETAYRIHALYRDITSKRLSAAGELAQHAVGLVKENVDVAQAPDY